MKRPVIELLIVALCAIPLCVRGVSALINHRIWVAPRNSAPMELVGSNANLMGMGYLAVAIAIFAVWIAIRTSHRKLGWALTGLCAAIAGVGFAGAFAA